VVYSGQWYVARFPLLKVARTKLQGVSTGLNRADSLPACRHFLTACYHSAFSRPYRITIAPQNSRRIAKVIASIPTPKNPPGHLLDDAMPASPWCRNLWRPTEPYISSSLCVDDQAPADCIANSLDRSWGRQGLGTDVLSTAEFACASAQIRKVIRAPASPTRTTHAQPNQCHRSLLEQRHVGLR
jgi:hypothetical protein